LLALNDKSIYWKSYNSFLFDRRAKRISSLKTGINQYRLMPKTDQHHQQVWEDFWKSHAIEQVYPNSDRIYRQICATGPLQKKWVMEIGAGSGRDGFQLTDLGARVIFLDYAVNSLQVIASLAQKYQKIVYLVRGDAFNLPFKEGAIDIVYHQGLLEHFTQPGGIIAENYRVLKIGGFAVADVPQRYHPYTLVKHVLITLNKWFAGWETEFSIGGLKALHRAAGFEIYAVYGDWMRPSFFYRAGREALKKIGVTLPLFPKRLPLISGLRDRLRAVFQRQKWALYTFMDIGVVARKQG